MPFCKHCGKELPEGTTECECVMGAKAPDSSPPPAAGPRKPAGSKRIVVISIIVAALLSFAAAGVFYSDEISDLFSGGNGNATTTPDNDKDSDGKGTRENGEDGESAFAGLFGDSKKAKVQNCEKNRGIINKQVESYYFVEGTWPMDDLSDIKTNVYYFPDGIPTCPVDLTSYALIPSPYHRVTGHREGEGTHIY